MNLEASQIGKPLYKYYAIVIGIIIHLTSYYVAIIRILSK